MVLTVCLFTAVSHFTGIRYIPNGILIRLVFFSTDNRFCQHKVPAATRSLGDSVRNLHFNLLVFAVTESRYKTSVETRVFWKISTFLFLAEVEKVCVSIKSGNTSSGNILGQ